MARGKKNGGGARRGGRKSKAESMTGAKAGAVEVRTGELALQSVEIDEKDVKTHMRSIKSAMEKKDTAVSLLRGCNKAAAAVHPDLPAAIKEALTEERKSDPAKLKARLEVLGITLKASGSTIQLNVFDSLSGDVQKQAYERGIADAKGNRMASNPYPEKSDLAAQYARGYRHGTADNMGIARSEADKAMEEEDEAAGSPMPEGAAARELALTH